MSGLERFLLRHQFFGSDEPETAVSFSSLEEAKGAADELRAAGEEAKAMQNIVDLDSQETWTRRGDSTWAHVLPAD